MIRWLSAGTLLLALGAPAAAQQIVIPAQARSLSGEPLSAPEVRLLRPDRGELRFSLEETLYVALFEMQPGRGVRLLYPADDATPERPMDAGWQSVAVPTADALASEPGTRFGQGPLAARYVLLVASRHALALAPGRRSPRAIAGALGLGDFRSDDASAQSRGVVAHLLALSSREPSDWTLASLTTTKAALAGLPGDARDDRILCPDGRAFAVKPGQSFTCPQR